MKKRYRNSHRNKGRQGSRTLVSVDSTVSVARGRSSWFLVETYVVGRGDGREGPPTSSRPGMRCPPKPLVCRHSLRDLWSSLRFTSCPLLVRRTRRVLPLPPSVTSSSRLYDGRLGPRVFTGELMRGVKRPPLFLRYSKW